MFTEQELADIKWLADKVETIIVAERNQTLREYAGYSDRPWMQTKVDWYKSQMARVERVQQALRRRAGDARLRERVHAVITGDAFIAAYNSGGTWHAATILIEDALATGDTP